MKHTPGPLRVEASNVYAFKESLGIDVLVAKTFDLKKDHTGTGEFSLGEMKANAARIVACWNACEGINPEAVPDLLEALEEMLVLYADHAQYDDSDEQYESKTIKLAQDAIALAANRKG